MRYSNRDSFIISAAGAMYTDPDSLESIMAGNEAGAQGCALPVRMSQDAITLLCSGSVLHDRSGEAYDPAVMAFPELRRVHPKVVTFGQALELAKSCAAKICVELRDPAAAPHARVALRYSEYLENAYFCGLSLPDAADLARTYPDLQIMADLTEPPESAAALVRAIQEHGLFGLRAAPAVLTEELCAEALRCGLFLASTPTDDPAELGRMLEQGVNFIETDRPDLAYALLPQPEFS